MIVATRTDLFDAAGTAATLAAVRDRRPLVLSLTNTVVANLTANMLLAIGALIFMAACWFGIREQAAVNDRQFIRSMIPHHAGAVLMCEQNRLSDPALQRLCDDIVQSQRSEIAQMKELLEKAP